MTEKEALDGLAAAYRDWLTTLPPGLHAGVEDTPSRVIRSLAEITSGYHADVPALFTNFDAEGYDQMVALSGIPFVSTCEHHVMFFTGHAHIAYLPSGKLVGLSKMPRLVRAYAHRLQLQERLTQQVADALWENLSPRGVMVVIEATHSCMCNRGARSNGVMRTSAVFGLMREDPAARAEAEWLLKLS